VHSFEVVRSMRVFDPLAPIVNDPFFRPVLPDLFFSDFLDLVPNPFLLRGPTVFIESSAAGPMLGLKTAISVGALLVAAYYWYQERGAVRAQLQRAFGGNQRSQLKSASVEDTSDSSERATRDLDGMREEMGKEGLKLWESAYKLRPAPSARPSDWTVDDLCFMLEQQGLANCSERLRSAGIDGRVALTLTSADEDDIRNELGVDKLGERRRLLLFLDELRSMQAAAAGSAPDGAP